MNNLPEKYQEFLRLNPGFLKIGNNRLVWERAKLFPDDLDLQEVLDDLIEAYSLKFKDQLDQGYPFALPEKPEKYLGQFPFATSETGAPVCLSLEDLSTQILISGATNSTKTGTINAIINSIVRSNLDEKL